MFSEAYTLASDFTFPVIVSIRFFDQTVECALGCFVILNSDGCFATAAHVLEVIPISQQHSKEISAYDDQVRAIEQDRVLSGKQKTRRIRHLRTNPKWITNHSFWWAKDGVTYRDLNVLPEGDLAIGRLEPFDPTTVKHFPVLKDPGRLLSGTSLCKLGFPFYEIKASFKEQSKSFEIAPETFPIPRFPIEGIFTRNLAAGKSKDGKHEINFLETSSPGLRGQSGGPIFDRRGTVWAIQSKTAHLPLGFNPKAKKDGREVEEHQFLNVGLGIHPTTLISFLRERGVKFQLSDY